MRSLGLALVLAHLGTACGGSPPPPPDAPAEPAPAATAEAPPSAPSEGAAAPAEAAPDPITDAPPDEPKGRDIVYRPSSTALVIEVEGVEIEPTAQIKPQGGGHQLTLRLRVSSRDGKEHRFLKSEKGILMVAGELMTGGNTQRITDERTGDGEETVAAGASVELTQAVDPVLRGKQSLTLQVGLWGLARGDEKRRPVKRLFLVKVVPGKRQPAAVVIPPE